MDSKKFDIDFVTSHFGTCDLGHYIRVIQSTSTSELRELRAKIISHERSHHTQLAFSNTPGLTTHGALLKAINYTILKRSRLRHRVWLIFLSPRQWLARILSGMTLKKDPNFGAIYTRLNHRKSVLHMSLDETGRALLTFAAAHWKFLITTVIAIAAIVVEWLRP